MLHMDNKLRSEARRKFDDAVEKKRKKKWIRLIRWLPCVSPTIPTLLLLPFYLLPNQAKV
jgi:hypothetical protein